MDSKKVPSTIRNVLWYLVFCGFAVNYMIRINLNIAIVEMVKTRINKVSVNNECLVNISTESPNFLIYTNQSVNFLKSTKEDQNSSYFAKNSKLNDKSINAFKKEEDLKFDWDEKVQGSVLGSFYWLHFATQLPGGILAGKYGTKLVFGLGNFLAVLCNFLIPTAAYWGAMYLNILRTFQGLVCGVCWPAMHNMTAKWIPPNERSKFVTSYLGSSVGAALTYPICGFIIDRWGWELVFYVCGVLGTIWFVAWWMLAYDTPAEHPRISQSEKEYIINSLGQSVAKTQPSVPWRKIMTDGSVWMNVFAQWGGVWGLFTLMTHAPTYIKVIHNLNIKATGFLSGLPHLLRMLWAFMFSQFGDYLLRSNKMSRSNVRKLATVFCTIVQGLFILLLAYSGCNAVLAIVFLTLAITVNGSVSTGALASVVDISPNYASVILGLMNTAVAAVGFITPTIVGYLTYNNQTTKQWQKVFWIGSGISAGCGVFFTLFAKSELKSWNTPKDKKLAVNTAEMEKMVKSDPTKDEESISVKEKV